MSWEETFSTRWPAFKIEEILGPDQLDLFKRKGVFPYSFRALDKLQAFRESFGMPFIINHGDQMLRGARSMTNVWAINAQTRGKPRAWEYSFHLWCAFDISVNGIAPEQLYKAALNFGQWGGVGLYNTFVHCDDRDYFTFPASWDARYPKPKT